MNLRLKFSFLICFLLKINFTTFIFAKSTEKIGEEYESFQDPIHEEFGLVNSKHDPCLFLKFHAKIYNFNLNGTDISTEVHTFFYSVMKKSTRLTKTALNTIFIIFAFSFYWVSIVLEALGQF